MEPQQQRGRAVWALAGFGVLGLAVVAAIVVDLGPFEDPELSRGELIASGDRICADAHDAFTELQRREPQTARQAADLTGQLEGIATDELDRIRALNGPGDFEAEIDRYLAARERGIEALRDGRSAADEGDSDAYVAAQAELAASQLERRRIAREIGFGECSRPLVGRAALERQAKPPPSSSPDAPPTVANPPTGSG